MLGLAWEGECEVRGAVVERVWECCGECGAVVGVMW